MSRRKSFDCISAGLLCIALQARAQNNVLTANYDNRRTNVNQFETILTPAKMRSGQFGKLGSVHVIGQIYAQPLYLGAVQIAGAAKNVVYVVTMHNYVYAIDADNPNSTSALWQVQLGDPVPSSTFASFTDIRPE